MIRVASFTQLGTQLAGKIFLDWEPEEVDLCLKTRSMDEPDGLGKWVAEAFSRKDAIVFIGACTIAVRLIAPFVNDKLTDSPVLVMDELGQYVIPILSGHEGGANELARRIAQKSGAKPVITSATDLHNKFAVDVFAKKNKLTILNKEGIAQVSGKILRGEQATMSIQPDSDIAEQQEYGLNRILSGRVPQDIKLVSYPPTEQTDIVISTDPMALKMAVLRLKPKQYVIGIGCKRGKTKEEIEAYVNQVLLDWNPLDVAAVASIDRKADEEGILGWVAKYQLPFVTYSEDELLRVYGKFTASDFVEQQVGVDNVCERSAIAAAGVNSRLVMKKQAGDGITLALAKRSWGLVFDGLEK